LPNGLKAELNQIGLKMHKGDIVDIHGKRFSYERVVILEHTSLGISFKKAGSNLSEIFAPWTSISQIVKFKNRQDENGAQPTN